MVCFPVVVRLSKEEAHTGEVFDVERPSVEGPHFILGCDESLVPLYDVLEDKLRLGDQEKISWPPTLINEPDVVTLLIEYPRQ